MTAAELASPNLASALHEETEGNPLFFGETVRLLSLEGIEPERLTIPPSVRDVILRRLGHLSEECRRILVLCSVLGRDFALHALARFAAVSEEQLLETLDEAVVARVVSDVPGAPGRFRFAHVLIRDSLYDGLTTTRRVRLHRLAVEALDAYYGDEPGPGLAELAHHAIAGSDFERGMTYARRAGDHALALLAYEESARLYRLAIDALELTVPNDVVRCELFLALGDAESAAGDGLAAKSAFLEAAGIAQRASLGRSPRPCGGRLRRPDAVGSRRRGRSVGPASRDGLAALAGDDVELRARLLARLAGALRDDHSRDRRDRLSAEAVELARRAENDAALAFALDGRVGAIIAPDTISEFLALSSELCGVAMRIGDRERLVAGHWNRFIAVLVGDMAEAGEDLAAASRIAEELKQPVEFFQVRATEAMLALAEGRLADAEKLVPAAFALGETAVPEMAGPVFGLRGTRSATSRPARGVAVDRA